jgi:ATP-dependent DNA helicase DinG
MSAATLSPAAAGAVRAAIRLAGGREVCFVCTLDADRNVATARVVARGDANCVLALPGFARAGEMLLHNHPSGNLEPSDPDLHVAAKMHDQGVGFAITDNDASELYVVIEVPKLQVLVPLDLAAIDHDLGPDGAVARQHGAYEDRQGQRDYAASVGPFGSCRRCAPTGTGDCRAMSGGARGRRAYSRSGAAVRMGCHRQRSDGDHRSGSLPCR